jgi:transcriptional regulator with XRE-family HTH domain
MMFHCDFFRFATHRTRATIVAQFLSDTRQYATIIASLWHYVCMTMTQTVLDFDRSDRMKKALRLAEMGVAEIADELGVTRATVDRWLSGAVEPKRGSVLAFAMLTGVPYEWLELGSVPDGWEWSRPRESNPRPSHYE